MNNKATKKQRGHGINGWVDYWIHGFMGERAVADLRPSAATKECGRWRIEDGK
jgi:hypothetical protein